MRPHRAANALLRGHGAIVRSHRSPKFIRHRSVVAEPEVRILEVGARDGLQNIKQKVDTSVKVDLIRRLAASGLRAIEATSFVAPKWIPQLADSREVMKEVLPLQTEQSIWLPVLVPNMKGLERAAQSGAKEAVVFASASEGFSWKNTNCSVEDGLKRAEEVVEAASALGIRSRGSVLLLHYVQEDQLTFPLTV